MKVAELWIAVNERSNARCEWIYPDFTRCQNTMSLRIHHKTYDRYGNELLNDVSLLCPSHHLMADIIRKIEIGQREDIVLERSQQILRDKCSRLDNVSVVKFLSRLEREESKFLTDRDSVYLILDYIEYCTQTENAIEMEAHNYKLLIWFIKVMALCCTAPESNYLAEVSDYIQAQLENGVIP